MQAYIDLNTYQSAGSIPAAINAVNTNASNAKDALQALRSTPFVEDTFSQRLRVFIWPTVIASPPDQSNLGKVRQWMSTHELVGVPVAVLLNSGSLTNQRKQAVSDLSVP